MNFLLQRALLEPGCVTGLANDQLNQLVAEARSTRLLASLGLRLEDAGQLDQLPSQVSRHLRSGIIVHEKQKRDLDYESKKIRQILRGVNEKVVLLKGAAYILGDLPVGRGRLITDIDILIPRDSLGRVEDALKASGWEAGPINAYDDHYYREWGHEIPPLTHTKRGTTLDVHHNILPPTAAPNVDANLLWHDLIEVQSDLFILSWQDMVIHSATHLFHEGEFHHGLRDLWDLDRMLRDFPARDNSFWDNLVRRARQLGLLDSLYHGLNYAQHVFDTPVPGEVIREAESRSRRLRRPLMDFLFLRAFRPDLPRCRLPFTGLALFLLYVRSHYLRMPLYMLLPHLTRKAWKRHTDKEKTKITNGATQRA